MEGSRFVPPALVTHGEVWGPKTGGGEIGGDRHFDGPGLGRLTAWKCPACGQENVSDYDLGEGCAHCGAGKAGKHIGVDPLTGPGPSTVVSLQREMGSPTAPSLQTAFDYWLAREGSKATLLDAFEAGWIAGAQQQAHMLVANGKPRVSSTKPEVAFDPDPLFKARRTVVAALRLFRDQVLKELAPEEFADHEWCTVEECEAVIAQIESEGL
jgi:hypothetical protein